MTARLISRRQALQTVLFGTGSLFVPGLPLAKEMRLMVVGQALIKHDLRNHAYPGFQPLCEHLSRGDVCFSNLETPILAAMAKDDARGAPPEVLDCLKAMSFNLLALSNNHSFDLGPEGIYATIEETRRRGIAHAGTGAVIGDAGAAGFCQSRSGVAALVAFASNVFSDIPLATENRPGVNHLCLAGRSMRPVESSEQEEGGSPDPLDAQRILASLKLAAQKADLVIAYQHDHYWEPDWQRTPDWKRRWARRCIDAGAHAYISHGVPLVHGVEIYKQRPIFYGLGSFILQNRLSTAAIERSPISKMRSTEPAVWESVVADCLFRSGKLTNLRLEPMACEESGSPADTLGRPSLVYGQRARAILERVRTLSAPFGTSVAISGDAAEVKL